MMSGYLLQASRIDEWLKDDALPLWGCEAYDHTRGGFSEAIDFDGRAMSATPRRVRVQFRQMYVYSHAAMLGLAPEGAGLARKGFEHVARNAWAPDSRRGWAHVLNSDGTVRDGKRDLYDSAFALMSLAWFQRATMNPRASIYIQRTLDFLNANMVSRFGGWMENDQGETKRRQNPHMHLLEASLALYDATGDTEHLGRAEYIVDLFKRHFYDQDRGVLLEYFDERLRPLGAAKGQVIEPGHLMEWTWLLREFSARSGKNVDKFADTLYANALKLGLDRSGRFMVDEVNLDGTVAKSSRRLWPQTEFLKAAIAQYRRYGDERHINQARRLVGDIFDDYLSGRPKGAWRDKMDGRGTCISDDIPASTFYHLFVAFTEASKLLREVEGELTPADHTAAKQVVAVAGT